MRARIEELLIQAIVVAVGEARFAGPARVVSVAMRAGAERVESAKRYGRESAALRMKQAGFDKRDYELDADDITAMVRAEVRRVFIEAELWECLPDD